MSTSLCDPITLLINKSIENGHVPNTLKIAKVVPIYKSKDQKQLSNYRPISLLPSISKILEKVIHKHVYNFLNHQNIFYQSQYGFRPKHSTINAVMEFTSDILKSIEKSTIQLVCSSTSPRPLTQ